MDGNLGHQFSQRALCTVRTLLRNGSHHEIDLISLLAVDLLASRYDVNDLISFIWEERLQPGNSREIFHLLCLIARGYRSECQPLLSYFQHQIEETISASLNDTNMPRNRFVLIFILGKSQNEVYGGNLDSEHYYDEMAE
jgi:hypothetical protein